LQLLDEENEADEHGEYCDGRELRPHLEGVEEEGQEGEDNRD